MRFPASAFLTLCGISGAVAVSVAGGAALSANAGFWSSLFGTYPSAPVMMMPSGSMYQQNSPSVTTQFGLGAFPLSTVPSFQPPTNPTALPSFGSALPGSDAVMFGAAPDPAPQQTCARKTDAQILQDVVAKYPQIAAFVRAERTCAVNDSRTPCAQRDYGSCIQPGQTNNGCTGTQRCDDITSPLPRHCGCI